MCIGFDKESEFELALVQHLTRHGWENDVLVRPTEEDLVKNWANIIYENNRGIAQLNNCPLTDSEMRQIIDKVNMCDSPYAVSRFINSQQVCIKRDNEEDQNNFGKEVYLKIFDAKEISAGQSRYQIVRQPRFQAAHPLAGDRRGDVMLLINGMPVIHIELKRSSVDVSQAAFQIKRYVHEGVFRHGVFSMVQIFVAMTPTETLYFANPGPEDRFQSNLFFHWEDFNNTVVGDWQRVATDLLSIPMAHQMVGYYTIADEKDKTLKVLRSYQYFAASKISDVVRQTNWDAHQHRGGYIWHTTGSGKTMTSFKSAQLIANSGDADKVVFLMDRIELSTQSLDEFRGFAGESDEVQDTADTTVLLSKLTSTDRDDRLIVTSIQKMYNIRVERGINQGTIDSINKKRLVFIIDECHRSVFGEMLISIKNTFTRALLFGFTGTPVFEENAHNEITTGTLFGDMLHKYTIANGIPDGNVLGFDLYQEMTYDDDDLSKRAALHELRAQTLEEIEDDEEKMAVYNKFMTELQMASEYNDSDGKVRHGIEYYLPKDIYQKDIHHQAVAEKIVEEFPRLSKNGKFHAILATQNIPEAIAYYELFKAQYPSLNVVSVFDNNIDNSDNGIVREDALLEMLTDYNTKYHTTFQLSTYGKYKKDVAKRLAHKKPYIGIENDHSQQIDILIVVTQMLTGYDSKWVNTLHVDKVMKYVDIIQAFSRTNRIFGPDKPFGIIKYYSFPYTMKQNIADALEVYVDRPLGVFVDKLEDNLMNINRKFLHIRDIFHSHEIFNFERLPDTREDRNMFAQDFSQMTHLLEAAKLQGFVWEKNEYEFQHGDTYTRVRMEIDEQTYLILLQRYRELFDRQPTEHDGFEFDYPVDTFITETGAGTIDAEYIDSKFQRFIKNLYMTGPGSDLTKKALEELHKTFASLSQQDQRTALIILHDIQRGDLTLEIGKTLQDYIAQYQRNELRKQILILSEATDLNASALQNIIESDVTEDNLNEFNRFEDLKQTLNLVKSRAFLAKVWGTEFPARMTIPKMDELLTSFILDPRERARILAAYLNDEITLANAPDEPVTAVPSEESSPEEITPAAPEPIDEPALETSMSEKVKEFFNPHNYGLRKVSVLTERIFHILDKPSTPDLDGIGDFLKDAFRKIYGHGFSKIDRHVAFNTLVTKYEAYLKKLYYLINKEEIAPRRPGGDVMFTDAARAFDCLWNLKYNYDPKYQLLYRNLEKVKSWRNESSHVAPTATEEELSHATEVVVTMYYYVTGSSLYLLSQAERAEEYYAEEDEA